MSPKAKTNAMHKATNETNAMRKATKREGLIATSSLTHRPRSKRRSMPADVESPTAQDCACCHPRMVWLPGNRLMMSSRYPDLPRMPEDNRKERRCLSRESSGKTQGKGSPLAAKEVETDKAKSVS